MGADLNPRPRSLPCASPTRLLSAFCPAAVSVPPVPAPEAPPPGPDKHKDAFLPARPWGAGAGGLG